MRNDRRPASGRTICVIRRGQPKLRLPLDETTPPDDPCRDDWRDVWLALYHAGPAPGGEPTEIVRRGAWEEVGYPPDDVGAKWELPPLIFQAADLDTRGNLIFMLEGRLEGLIRGRFEGRVYRGGREAGRVDVDLRDSVWFGDPDEVPVAPARRNPYDPPLF
jgi:hypothetical protein